MSVRRDIRRLIPGPIRQRLYDRNLAKRSDWLRTPGLRRTGAKAAASLSFDDGPDPQYTPPLLDALDRAGAKASFFLVGERVAEHPSLVTEIAARGHEIGLHGMSHRRHDALDLDAAHGELTAGLAAIESTGVARPRWYRPPYGATSPTLAACCEELRLELAYWSSWGQDWDPIDAATIARLVVRDLQPGAIVLLHDSPLYAERRDARPTIEAVPAIAAAARSRGLALVTIGDAANDPAQTMPS